MAKKTQYLALGAGRRIGVLERLLVFLFALMGQYAAIGLLVAVNGIARSKQMEDNRSFGEYVLI